MKDGRKHIIMSISDCLQGDYVAKAVLSDHTADVTAVTLHPTRDYFVTASLDKTWAFYDIARGLCMTQVLFLHGIDICFWKKK